MDWRTEVLLKHGLGCYLKHCGDPYPTPPNSFVLLSSFSRWLKRLNRDKWIGFFNVLDSERQKWELFLLMSFSVFPHWLERNLRYIKARTNPSPPTLKGGDQPNPKNMVAAFLREGESRTLAMAGLLLCVALNCSFKDFWFNPTHKRQPSPMKHLRWKATFLISSF